MKDVITITLQLYRFDIRLHGTPEITLSFVERNDSHVDMEMMHCADINNTLADVSAMYVTLRMSVRYLPGTTGCISRVIVAYGLNGTVEFR